MEKEASLRELTEALTYRDMLMKENEKNFQDMFFLNPVAMVITQMNGIIIKINEAVTRIFGYTKDDIYGTSVIDLYADKSERTKILNLLRKNGHILHYPALFLSKEKKIIPCIMSSKIIKLRGEDHILSALFDVSWGKEGMEDETVHQ